MLRGGLRLARLSLGAVALAWSCGGSLVSSPDGGEADGSASSGGSSGGISTSSSGASSSASGSSTSSGSSSGSSASSGSGSSGGSTSSSSGSGSSGSSGSSGGSGGSGSGGPSCGISCTWDVPCQDYCPPVAGGGTNCCDQATGVCYATTSHICPLPADAGCHDIYPICPINDAGYSPPNPNTGSYGCDGCIQCSCGSPWCDCGADSTLDIAGNVTGGCLAYANCVILCTMGDAGAQQCAQQCSGGAPYTQQQLQEGDALLACISSACAAPTTCGR